MLKSLVSKDLVYLCALQDDDRRCRIEHERPYKIPLRLLPILDR